MTRWTTRLLLLKLVVALGYTYFFFQVYPNSSDTWGYFAQSRQIAGMVHTPGDFFSVAFPDLHQAGDLLHYHFWNDLKENIFVLLLLGMNLLTFHNPYGDTLLFTLLTFTGWLRFIRLLRTLYPGLAPGWYCVPFLLPTFLFCYSGLHSDGLVFCVLGWLSYDAYRACTERPSRGMLLRLVFFGLLLACLKAFLFAFLVPTGIAWWAVYRKKIRPAYVWPFLAAAMLGLILLSIPEQAGRQHEYLMLNDQKAILPEAPMEPTLSGWVRRFPQAVLNAFFRPAPWEKAYKLYLADGLTVWALLLLGVYSLRVRRSFFETTWVCLAGIAWLLAGYAVPVLSAIVRYRSLFYPFLLAFSLLPLLKPGKVDFIHITRREPE